MPVVLLLLLRRRIGRLGVVMGHSRLRWFWLSLARASGVGGGRTLIPGQGLSRQLRPQVEVSDNRGGNV